MKLLWRRCLLVAASGILGTTGALAQQSSVSNNCLKSVESLLSQDPELQTVFVLQTLKLLGAHPIESAATYVGRLLTHIVNAKDWSAEKKSQFWQQGAIAIRLRVLPNFSSRAARGSNNSYIFVGNADELLVITTEGRIFRAERGYLIASKHAQIIQEDFLNPQHNLYQKCRVRELQPQN